MAIDIHEADLPEPAELRLDIEQPVGRVLLVRGEAQSAQEPLVQARRRRRDVLKVAENAARFEQAEDLLLELALALVLEVVDSEAGDDRVESASQVG